MTGFVHRCPMRWSDVDALGHVADTSYLRYLEECRLELVYQLFPQYEAQDLARGSVVTRQCMTYLRPLCYRADPILVETWVRDVKAAVVCFGYLVRDDSHAYAEGEADLVPVDLRYGTPRRFTDNERAFLTTYLRPDTGRLAVAARMKHGG